MLNTFNNSEIISIEENYEKPLIIYSNVNNQNYDLNEIHNSKDAIRIEDILNSNKKGMNK